MRLLIQCQTTGRFLVPDELGTPVWVHGLRQAGGGVVFDVESAHQLISDHLDPWERVQVVDLDRLGTEQDYTD